MRSGWCCSDGRARSCCRWRIRSSRPAWPTTATSAPAPMAAVARLRDTVRSMLALSFGDEAAYGTPLPAFARFTRACTASCGRDRRVSGRHAVFGRGSGAAAVGARHVHRFGGAGLRARGRAAVGGRARCVSATKAPTSRSPSARMPADVPRTWPALETYLAGEYAPAASRWAPMRASSSRRCCFRRSSAHRSVRVGQSPGHARAAAAGRARTVPLRLERHARAPARADAGRHARGPTRCPPRAIAFWPEARSGRSSDRSDRSARSELCLTYHPGMRILCSGRRQPRGRCGSLRGSRARRNPIGPRPTPSSSRISRNWSDSTRPIRRLPAASGRPSTI